MFCERCNKNPSTVQYTEIINNQKRQLNLCQECVQGAQQVLGNNAPLNLHGFLAGLMDAGLWEQQKHKTVSCEACRLTEEQFARQGVLGCADCYGTFGSCLEPLLRRLHGSVRHVGKVPYRSREKHLLAQEVDRLRTELQEAVDKEDFEKAAEIRDEIKRLEQQLS